MPKLMNTDMETGTVNGMQNFQFSGTRTDKLGATEYTLVSIAVDTTGSMSGFENEVSESLKTAIEACKKSPRSNNLLLRVTKFSTSCKNNVEEIHGFKLLSEIDLSQYANLNPRGTTPLYDASYEAVGATMAYAKKLMDNDYLVNGIVFIITDGEEYPYSPNNPSVATPTMIAKEMKKAITGEAIESLVSILVGINDSACSSVLQQFQTEAAINKYIKAGEATKGKLAKLAEFVSQSISSQSQSLGTGGPSQNIAATI